MKSQSGQMLMMSVLILAVLLISIAVVVSMHDVGSHFTVAQSRRNKTMSVAQEGLAYAQHELSQDLPTWTAALSGNCPDFSAHPSTSPYNGSSGGAFTIQCTTGPLSYQVTASVMAGIVDPATGLVSYLRGLQAVFSPKTITAVLPSEVKDTAALYNLALPTHSQALTVLWGADVMYSIGTWPVHGENNQYQFPRKFSQGDITDGGDPGFTPTAWSMRSAGSPPQETDGKEYWATSTLGTPATIDLSEYQNRAMLETGVPVAISSASCTPTCTGIIAASPPGSGYFTVPAGDIAVFAGNWTLSSSSAVIYVNGNAQWNDIAVDIKSSGAFVVNGDLTLSDNNASGNALTNIRVPSTAPLEYPYYPTRPASWPCSAKVGQNTCTAAELQAAGYGNGKVQFRGFLYVKGRLQYATTAASQLWLINGAVRSDGPIDIPMASAPAQPATSANWLSIVYDDEISHNILASPLELMIDSIKDINH